MPVRKAQGKAVGFPIIPAALLCLICINARSPRAHDRTSSTMLETPILVVLAVFAISAIQARARE
jgi:hypothetical protein